MSAGHGWIGSVDALLNYLRVVGADQDEEGRFVLQGEPPVSFMGIGDEFVIPEGCEYLVKGQPKNLAAGLRSTSQGLGCMVIA